MQFKFFAIPLHDDGDAAEELNRFLASHRVSAIDRSFVQDGVNSAWALCVSFEPTGNGRPQPGKRTKIDYKEVLNEEDFAVFARLRALRKEIADSEGVPAYALFTNEQLAAMVQRRVQTRVALGEIPGIGEGRIDKYGEAFLQMLREVLPKESPQPNEGYEA